MNARKMRTITSMLLAGIIALTASSCSENTEQQPQKGPELVFSVSPLTRAAMNYPIEDYFTIDNQVAVWTNVGGSIYEHNNGLLEYASGDEISFPAYNQSLGYVQLLWPVDYTYSYDQTTKEAFLASDQLICEFFNLMPSTLVPVEFTHAYYKMTFELGGTNAGKRIASLSINGDPETFEAFCDPAINDAQLMLQPGVDLSWKTGFLTIEGESTPRLFSMPAHTPPAYGEYNQNITVTIIL